MTVSVNDRRALPPTPDKSIIGSVTALSNFNVKIVDGAFPLKLSLSDSLLPPSVRPGCV